MTSELTTFGKNKQANAIAYDKAALHTGAPGDDGSANEITTIRTQAQIDNGDPAYARKAMTFSAAVDGARDSNIQPLFDIPPTTTPSHFSLWEGANCVGKGTLQNAETYLGQGEYTLTDGDILNT
jgi:hypothetical protein